MLRLSVIFLLVCNPSCILGPAYGKQILNDFEADGTREYLTETVSNIHGSKKGFRTLPIHGHADGTGQTLQGCFGGIGHLLSSKLHSKKNSKGQRVCYCKRCYKNTGNMTIGTGHIVEKAYESCIHVKADACHGRNTASNEGTAKYVTSPTEDLKLPRSPTDPREAMEAPDSSNSVRLNLISDLLPQGRQEKKTYRSKKGGNWLPKTSSKGSSEFTCEICCKKSSQSCLDICLKPACFCLLTPLFLLDLCCYPHEDPTKLFCDKCYG